ncbi:MAG: polysaccharide biosynthesis tyrosine autokinase [Bacteroidota bacterium]
MRNGASKNGASNGAPYRPGANAASATLDLRILWEAVTTGWWIILLVAGLVIGSMYYYVEQLTPIYRASSIVKISNSQMVGPENPYWYFNERSIEIELGVLTYSEEIPLQVARRLVSMAEAMGTYEFYTVLDGLGRGDEIDLRRAANRIAARTSFAPSSFANMIRLAAESPVPEEAALLATLYAEEYKTYTREKSRESLRAARDYLETQVQRRQDDLTGEEQQWLSFARNREVTTYGASGEVLVGQYQSLSTRLDETILNIQVEQAALAELRAELERIDPSLSGGQVEQELESTELEQRLRNLDSQILDLEFQRDKFYINDPSVRGRENEDDVLAGIMRNLEARKNQRQEIRDQLISEAAGAQEAQDDLTYSSTLRAQVKEKEIQISGLQTLRETLRERLGAFDSRLDQLPRQAIEQEQLQRRIAMAEQVYSTFAQRLQQVIISEESELGYIDVVQEARVPGFPIRPDKRQNMLLGILMGFGLGFGLAFLRVLMDTRIETPEDVKKRGHNLLGVVPIMKDEIKTMLGGKETIEVGDTPHSTKLLTLHSPWSPTSENFRLIRTNLFQTNAHRTPQVMFVTSPEPGDGKSVSTMNLAISLAQSGRRTLIIDADMRRPTAHKLLGATNDRGLAGLLLQREAFEPSRFETHIERLSFIASGSIDTPPGELLGHERMAQLLATFRDEYDTVIIDTPPVLAVTDTLTLAKHCDGGILVVSANRTNDRAYSAAEEALAKAGIPLLGVILNRLSSAGSGRSKYGYGYGYGYYKEYAHA